MTVTPIAPDEHLVLTPEQCETFLEILAARPGVGHVATLRELGVPGTRRQIKDAIERQLKAELNELRNDVLRTELLRRGVEGVVEDVWHNGEVVGQRVVYSDRCLIAVAQMRLPEARNQLDVNLGGRDGGPVRVEVEGGRVTSIGDVIELAASLGGQSLRERLSAAAARGALPAAAPLLPDPRDG